MLLRAKLIPITKPKLLNKRIQIKSKLLLSSNRSLPKLKLAQIVFKLVRILFQRLLHDKIVIIEINQYSLFINAGTNRI